MTKRSWISLSGFFFAILILLSCAKSGDSDECLSYTKAPVTKVEGPNSGSVDQELTFIVSFGCFNGCGQFGNFEETSNGDTTTITVIAKYEGCICTLDAPVRQTIYKFKVAKIGTYYLKFLQAETNYLVHTIKIQ